MELTEEQVQREANRLIEAAAARNNVSIDAIPEDAKQQARDYARQNLEREAGGRREQPLSPDAQRSTGAHQTARSAVGSYTRVARSQQ
jgi:hypothetical protein